MWFFGLLLPGVTGETQVQEGIPEILTFKETERAAVDLMQEMNRHLLHGVQAGDAEENQDNTPDEPDDDQIGNDDSGNGLECLEAHRETYLLYIFRADPRELGRTTHLPLQLQPGWHLHEVQTMLQGTWPDLQGGANWKLLEVTGAVGDSTTLYPPGPVFLLWAETDLLDGEPSSIVLTESQIWDLELGSLHSTMWPLVLPSPTTTFEIYEELGMQQYCQAAICPIVEDDVIKAWKSQFSLWDASFVTLGFSGESPHFRGIIGDPTRINVPNYGELPRGFQDIAEESAQQECPDRINSRVRMAVRHQMALTNLARDVYWKTEMSVLYNPHIQVFKLADRVAFHPIIHSATRDPFGLLLDLVNMQLVPTNQDWSFVEMHRSVETSQLPPGVQYVAVLADADRYPQPMWKMTLIEIEQVQLHEPPPCEYRSKMLPPVLDKGSLLQELYLVDICQQVDCATAVNGQFLGEGQQAYISDGAFINIKISETQIVEKKCEIAMPVEDDINRQSQTEAGHSAKKRRLETEEGAHTQIESSGETVMFAMMMMASMMGYLENRRSRTIWRFWLRWAGTLIWIVVGQTQLQQVAGMIHISDLLRIGEALHPGPRIWIGTANPSGLRGKEDQLPILPMGVWGVNETHLSVVNTKSVVNQIKRAGLQQQRHLYVSPGAPAPLRARSQSEGAWTGVCTVTDLVPREIHLHWPQAEYSQGRVQVHELWFGPFRIVGANVYLWPTSPTWPQAVQASEQLLQTLTQEVVYSRRGPRYILGDFNREPEKLPSIEHWVQQGWREIQDVAEHYLGKPKQQTYRELTAPDQIWISPEMIQYFQDVNFWSIFSDHKVVGGLFDVPVAPAMEQVWTLPSTIPWAHINKKDWQRQDMQGLRDETLAKDDVHQQYQAFWKKYEDSFDGYIDVPGNSLPGNMRGRAQRLVPEKRAACSPLLKPSRQGEICMASDFLGRATSRWFTQARRIQSLKHAIVADKQTSDAQLYRAEVWRAIRKAKGFRGTFPRWWMTRPVQLQGAPNTLPASVPSQQQIVMIFEDFQYNHRRMEAWHARRRSEILRCQYEADRYKIYEVVKPASKGSLTHLEEEQEALIIGISDDHGQVQLDEDLSTMGTVDFFLEGTRIQAKQDEDMILTFDAPQPDLEIGQEVTAVKHYSTPEEIDVALRSFWHQRWSKPPPTEGEWDRIIGFAAAYLPQCQPLPSTMSVAAWNEVNKRYTAKSARGPDGVAAQDLLNLPDGATETLLEVLDMAENQGIWPESLTTGFVHSLPKRETAKTISDYRPVIIYSVVYRSWSSMRARSMLRRIAELAGPRQFGFMPGQETAEVWILTQALIELAILRDQPLAGFVCDIQKAFENIPREPIRKLAIQLGFDQKVITLWFSFLSVMKRRFMVAGQVGESLQSTSGFPEGCGLSCVAMGIANLSYHAYMARYTARVTELSYVDNLAHLAENVAELQNGIVATQTWAKMWGFQLDEAKSYVWAMDSELRRTVASLGWKVCVTEKDLGAPMSYGKASASNILIQRIQTLGPLWKRLQRIPAPEWQKQLVIRTALWQRALYGCSNCCLPWNHIKDLRTAAMRALGHSRAGAAAGLRLHLCCHEQCDPGFFQCWNVLQTIRRVLIKRPAFLGMWTSFIQDYHGNPSRGPLAKLLEIGGQLGWCYDPPWIIDSDGCKFHLTNSSEKKLYLLARESWTQKISHEVAHRKDMEGLMGIDEILMRQMDTSLGAHRATINVLRDGTFIVDSKKAKFDYSKQGKCKFCNSIDTMDHRCTGCPMLQDIYAEHGDLIQSWDGLPKSLKHHCIPSRNPYWADFKKKMEASAEKELIFPQFSMPSLPHVDLFVDGSGRMGTIPLYSFGAWAVVNAQQDRTEASGVLHGLLQTSDRAELTAMACALEGTQEWSIPTTIWTDSAYVGQGAARLVEDASDLLEASEDHAELWVRIQQSVVSRNGNVTIQHTAAHRDVTANYQDLEGWSAYWNDRADRAANEAHNRRNEELLDSWNRLLFHHHQQKAICGSLHRLHVQIAERYIQQKNDAENDVEDYPEENDAMEENVVSRTISEPSFWLEDLPIGWLQMQEFMVLSDRFSMTFVHGVVECLLSWSQEEGARIYKISWLEMVILLNEANLVFPFPHPAKFCSWQEAERVPAGQRTTQTAAALVRLIRSFCQFLFQAFDLGSQKVTGICLLPFGVHTPQTGFTVKVTKGRLMVALQKLSLFTRSRPIRTVNDLARPLC